MGTVPRSSAEGVCKEGGQQGLLPPSGGPGQAQPAGRKGCPGQGPRQSPVSAAAGGALRCSSWHGPGPPLPGPLNIAPAPGEGSGDCPVWTAVPARSGAARPPRDGKTGPPRPLPTACPDGAPAGAGGAPPSAQLLPPVPGWRLHPRQLSPSVRGHRSPPEGSPPPSPASLPVAVAGGDPVASGPVAAMGGNGGAEGGDTAAPGRGRWGCPRSRRGRRGCTAAAPPCPVLREEGCRAPSPPPPRPARTHHAAAGGGVVRALPAARCDGARRGSCGCCNPLRSALL